jgi:D12 class N6 adenine-specific DNA methyltransferase
MNDDSFRAVTPIRPAAAYIGGKRRLGEQLARRIEAAPHNTYAEPFVGMGGVFFRRRWAARREVINDVSRDVATLFRILQRHYPQFMETLKFQIITAGIRAPGRVQSGHADRSGAGRALSLSAAPGVRRQGLPGAISASTVMVPPGSM